MRFSILKVPQTICSLDDCEGPFGFDNVVSSVNGLDVSAANPEGMSGNCTELRLRIFVNASESDEPLKFALPRLLDPIKLDICKG